MPRESAKPEHNVLHAEVERLLGELRRSNLDRLPRSDPAAPALTLSPSAGGGAHDTAKHHASSASRGSPRPLPSPAGVWSRLAAGVALAAGMTQWPYGACGIGLAGYVAAAVMLIIAAAWAARASWRRRMGFPHVLAIQLLLVGAALLAWPLLPHLYLPSAVWRCVQ